MKNQDQDTESDFNSKDPDDYNLLNHERAMVREYFENTIKNDKLLASIQSIENRVDNATLMAAKHIQLRKHKKDPIKTWDKLGNFTKRWKNLSSLIQQLYLDEMAHENECDDSIDKEQNTPPKIEELPERSESDKKAFARFREYEEDLAKLTKPSHRESYLRWQKKDEQLRAESATKRKNLRIQQERAEEQARID